MRWKRRIVISGIVLAWILSTAWLITREAFPGLLTRQTGGYRSLFSQGLLLMDNWMTVWFQDQRIGYSHTHVETDETDTLQQYVMNNRTVLTLTLMGEPQQVRVSVRASLDALYHLQRFAFALSTRGYALSVDGTRTREDWFTVTLRTGGTIQEFPVRIPDDTVLYSPMTEMTLGQLKPGQQTRLRIFNPISLSPGEVVVRALRREPLTHRGDTQEVTVLASQFEGMETLTWMTAGGQVLRQETPMGWRLEASDARDAVHPAATSSAPTPDLLTALAVPVDGLIRNPRGAPVLELILHAPGLRETDLDSHRQKVTRLTPVEADLTVRHETLPTNSCPLGVHDPSVAPYLADSPYLQITSGVVRQQAQSIVRDETNSLAAALAIHRWVNRSLTKEPVASIPAAPDILRVRRGDCNEHTTLFTALARSAGIPTRILVGLLYDDGAFYYHAWPAVYVGRWLELDPTLGQEAVDATHIRLLEGELSDQMRLMGLIGRLRVTVRAEDSPPPPAAQEENRTR